MTRRAWIYVWAVLLAGAALSWQTMPEGRLPTQQWPTFITLTVLATLAQLFKAEAPNHQLYYATRVFQFAGVLLLDPFLFVMLQMLSHLVEWAKERIVDSPHLRNWYLQPFNISVHILAGLAARWVYLALNADGIVFMSFWSVLAGAAAALTYNTVNHVIVGGALILARGVSVRESGILDLELMLPDLINLFLGYVVAVLWTLNPWLILPALSPLVLIYRALTIPQLKREAQTDPKTGLWNARHFSERFGAEMERATRFERPLAFIMADLDLLRNINNTYGHLAGDAVLVGVGQILNQTIREYDIAGRFGGEEFAIALPETGPSEAYLIAERIREAIQNHRFEISTSPTPINVTMSFGIACYPQDATNAQALVHHADIAVYQAKLKGRNMVVCSSDVPHSIRLDTAAPIGERGGYNAAFLPRTPMSGKAAGGKSQQEATASTSIALPAPATPQVSVGKRYPAFLSRLFIGGTIALGAFVSALGSLISAPPVLTIVGFFALLAVLAELLHIDLYESGSISVSVAIAFAAALIGGIPALMIVNAAIVAAHYFQRRPALYKTAFNWAAHMLAGIPAALLVDAAGLTLKIEQLPVLALPVLLAAGAYFLIDTGLVATAIGLSGDFSISEIWRQRYRWLAGHYLVLCIIGLFLGLASATLGVLGVIVFSLPVMMMRYSQKQYVERTEDSIRELQRMNGELTYANREVLSASHAIRNLNDELFLTLAKIIDARDPYVGGHAAKVADYATAIAIELGLPSDQVEQIRQAAFLHDIGKIGIAEHVLHKPGRLTNEEYEYVKTHVTLGAEFLATCQGLRHLVPLIRLHHERWDGRGYPDRLRREEIPLGARILSVCDAVEVMASDRPYHHAMTLEEIVNEIRRCSGSQFDPQVVEAFIRVIEREGEQFVTNSAREVIEKHAGDETLIRYSSGWFLEIERPGL